MTFRAIRLDPAITFGAQGGPDFETDISVQESGDEAREQPRAKGLGRWTISYAAKPRPNPTWEAFQDFWYIVGGERDSWMFKDWLDFECSAAQAFLSVIVADTTWQMWKRRTISSLTYDQKIVLPYEAFVTGGGTYSVSSTTGIITRNSGANPTGFSCKFDKLCRFGAGNLVQTIKDKKGTGDFFVTYAGIPVVEIPLTSA